MKKVTRLLLWTAGAFLIPPLLGRALTCAAEAPDPKTYIPTITEVEKHKARFDDPRPYLTTFGPKQVLPKSLYAELSYDVDAMKSAWADLVGFKAPDKVGKVAPEVQPGKYTYKDLEKHPGLKKLMWPDLYNRIRPGGPPHAGNIPEFEIIPTRQYYYALPISEAMKKNLGKTKLDAKGYLIPETWVAGLPFPKPSGTFKAQEIMANVEKRPLAWEQSFYIISRLMGYTKSLSSDFDSVYEVSHARLAGRTLMEPYGWFDKRAKEREEYKTFLFGFLSPRDVAGTYQQALYYLDPSSADQLMLYIPSMRRVRKLSATDTQDPVMGQDQIYDDNEGWMQKLSPTRYPYKYEVLEEREYLVPAPTIDGAEYISSKGAEFRNVRMERRPIYVVKLTELDSNYVYGHRIFYIDAETFNFYHIENYNQKGKLYRTWDGNYGWFPDMGIFAWAGMLNLMRDHIDLHSGAQQPYQVPAFWGRADLSVQSMSSKGK
ncbi:MAG: DUF1329 domain-containing protein [Deltaproteobacteria bacterium]|nr:DUF1329 domain-containing protein [Deltaproteobacteria bacterium]